MSKNSPKSTHFSPPGLPDGLFDKIMCRIRKEERVLVSRRRTARITLFSVGFFGSIVAFIPALKMVWSGFAESGFVDFFSLIFSDAEIVLAYWQNFALSLLETLPVVGLIALSATILVFLESFRFLAKDAKFIFSSKQLTI